MLFLTIEDLTGVMDAILSPDVYRQARDIVRINAPFTATGIVELDNSSHDPRLRVEKLERLR